MPRIVTARHAIPEHRLSQQAAKDAIRSLFSGQIPDLEAQLQVFDNSRIEQRHLLMPLDWYMQTRTAAERSQAFLGPGLALLQHAAADCLKAAELSARQVDHLIFVNSTGHATPTLDARLMNTLGCRRQASRQPIWGLGCAAGAAGLSRAWDYCLAHPAARVLLSALECCSLTLLTQDLSKKNLIGTSLFADGAAAVLIAGDEVDGAGPEIVASRSELFPDSYQIMGWNFCDEGMELILSPRLPALIKRELPALVDGFLRDNGLQRRDLRHYVTHPGGAKVIDAFRTGLGLTADELQLTDLMLKKYGNLSSVSVLVVLEQWLASNPAAQPGYGLLSAFGPGFSAEMLLLRV